MKWRILLLLFLMFLEDVCLVFTQEFVSFFTFSNDFLVVFSSPFSSFCFSFVLARCFCLFVVLFWCRVRIIKFIVRTLKPFDRLESSENEKTTEERERETRKERWKTTKKVKKTKRIERRSLERCWNTVETFKRSKTCECETLVFVWEIETKNSVSVFQNQTKGNCLKITLFLCLASFEYAKGMKKVKAKREKNFRWQLL